MDSNNLNAILALINLGLRLGGQLAPIALRAYAALRAESGMTDDQLIAASKALNAEDAVKLQALIDETKKIV